MPKATGHHSSELIAGQARLFQLRQQLQKKNGSAKRLTGEEDHGRHPFPLQTTTWSLPRQIPPHLGWWSERVTAVARAAVKQKKVVKPPVQPFLQPQTFPKSCSPTGKNSTVKLHPELAFSLLESGKETSGRLWFLLRHLDKNGRGWLTIDEARRLLTEKTSVFRVCGWRQLRNLLNQGEKLLWNRSNGRIWLQSLTNVAAALGIHRLNMKPVAFPIEILTQSIGKVRAHFYAAFHSSRSKTTEPGRREKPVSRATIAKITQVQARTQRRYEKIARVKKRSNYAIAGKATAEELEEQSWQRGKACFKLTDHKGNQGKPGRCYIAWQLPNSYVGPHQLAPKGKQKRINQALSDLFMKGMTGNGHSHFEPRYFANGRLAAKAFNRQSQGELYWYDHQLKLWHFLKH